MDSGTILYLSQKDVAQIDLPMSRIVDALEAMFVEKGEGRVEMPPKPGIHTRPDAFIHAMPAYIPSQEAAGMKWISGYPANQAKGLPYITGLMILNDPETGIPTAVMDASWITAKRTGAASAVAAKYLARTESRTLGVLACGVQGRSNLEAMACVFDLTRVKAYDLFPEIARRFADEMGPKLELDIEVVADPRDAVCGLDLVVTSGPIVKKPAPVIEAGWLSAGAFASPVDFDCYWTKESLHEVDKVATDDFAQMDYYRKVGYFPSTPQPYADLGEIVCGKKPGRQSDSERTVAINLGLALDDMATGVLVLAEARRKGLGLELPL